MNHFRALAIVLIVMGHSTWSVGFTADNIVLKIIFNLFLGGTSFFVFISGFLFYVVFSKRYDYKKFLTGKLKNLLIPYLVMSVIPITYFIFRKDNSFDSYFISTYQNEYFSYINSIVKYIWTGRFLNGYWYIPVALGMFFISPVHIYFIKTNYKLQLIIIFIMLIVSMLMHRPLNNIGLFQSLLYFQPVYLIGIFCGIYRKEIYSVFNGKRIYYILALALTITIYQALSGHVGSYHKSPFDLKGIDYMLLQKVFLCVFFMVLLDKFENVNSRFLHLIASTSFAVFFIHPFLIFIINNLLRYYSFSSNHHLIFWLVLVFSIFFIAINIALLLRKIFHKRSRYLIGY
jgi:hypothetical protein